MTVDHVYFRSGDVRCAGDLYLPNSRPDEPLAGVVDWLDHHLRQARAVVTSPAPTRSEHVAYDQNSRKPRTDTMAKRHNQPAEP